MSKSACEVGRRNSASFCRSVKVTRRGIHVPFSKSNDVQDALFMKLVEIHFQRTVQPSRFQKTISVEIKRGFQ
ncbi:MAG: hypothetical protein ACLGIW_16975, partial [Gammaproteobacteria bacterium]